MGVFQTVAISLYFDSDESHVNDVACGENHTQLMIAASPPRVYWEAKYW